MIGLLLAGGVSMLFALIGSPILIRWLQANGIGQQIREDGPQGHLIKAGTPTMGGIMIVGGALAGYLAAHAQGQIFTVSGLLVMGVTLAAAAVGLMDDWIKVRHARSLGLNKRAKIAGQLIVAFGFSYLSLELLRGLNTELSFTRFDSLPFGPMPTWVWALWAALMIIGTSNAVNLADGLDGLAGGSAAFAFSAFAIIGFWQFRHLPEYGVEHALDLALVAVALAGGCIGFLWWNAAPAKIFMGDTGSLGIGAGMAGLALMMNVHLLLPVVAGLFVLITLSDIIQIFSFRVFHRRVFRMAPLQHHFELAGWPETTVVIRFWILAALCTALAVGVFYADWISLGVLD